MEAWTAKYKIQLNLSQRPPQNLDNLVIKSTYTQTIVLVLDYVSAL